MPVTWGSPNWVTVTSSASTGTTLLFPTRTATTNASTLLTYDMNTPLTWNEWVDGGVRATGGFGWPSSYTLTGTPDPLPRRTIDEVARASIRRQLDRPPEEIAARQERARLASEVREASRTRARDILLIVLDDVQRAQYLADETFDVVGSAGNRYRIARGNSGNVHYLDPVTGQVAGRLCAHPSMSEHWLPDQDVALAQLLALTSDEPGFVRLANVHWGQRPRIAALAAA